MGGGGIRQVALEEPLAFVLLSPGPPITSGFQFRSGGCVFVEAIQHWGLRKWVKGGSWPIASRNSM